MPGAGDTLELGGRRERAYAAAAAVCDPEIPVLTIADLGVLREVAVDAEGGVEVTILPTYSGCPAMAAIAEAVEKALAAAGFGPVRVRLSHAPVWTTDMMSPAAHEKLRRCGIAPPARAAAGRADEPVPCPRCGSPATERISQFGSTACKALWRCTACREPFDHFKCV